MALRPEPFGALAYHFGNRRLSFLKAPELVELVRGLHEHARVTDALAGVAQARRPAFLTALASLASSDMIVPLDDAGRSDAGRSDTARGDAARGESPADALPMDRS